MGGHRSGSKDPTPSGAPSHNRRGSWPFVLLVVGMVLATLEGIGLGGRASVRESAEMDRLRLEGTAKVRALYWAQCRLGFHSGLAARTPDEGDGLSELRRLAALERSEDALRRLAIAAYALEGAGWREALLRMRLSSSRALSDVDRELAMWNVIFGSARAHPQACRDAAAFLDSARLGWYGHVAQAELYRRCGDAATADVHRKAALQATDRLTVLVAVSAVAGLAGSAVLVFTGVLWVTRRRVGASLVKPAALPKPAARVLVHAGASYFASLIVLRLLAPHVTSMVETVTAGSETGILYRALANLVSAAVSLLVPVGVLVVMGRRIGLTAADLGLLRPRAVRDVLGGLAGYSAAIPLLFLSLVISVSLFEPSASRINPAALDFARAHTLVSRCALLALAAIVAPAVEEFVFRGVLLRGLQSYHGFAAACVLTSAVFALLHPQLPMGFLSIFVLGAVFAVLYGMTGSLWPAMVAHALNNSMVFAYLALSLGG